VTQPTIDDVLAVLQEAKAQHGGKTPVVIPTGMTEDDIDRYTVYSYFRSVRLIQDEGKTPVLVLEAGIVAFER
jgi:hypothetical protein